MQLAVTIKPSSIETQRTTLDRMAECAQLAGRCRAIARFAKREAKANHHLAVCQHAERADRLANQAFDVYMDCLLFASPAEKRNGHLIRLARESAHEAMDSANLAASYIAADTVQRS